MPHPGESILKLQKVESLCKNMQECCERMGQVQTAEESWEPSLMRDVPALEDTDDESVFRISCKWNKTNTRHPPPVGDIEIEGTKTLSLIDTGSTGNIMDMVTFDKRKTRPIIRQTKTVNPQRGY